VQVMYLARSRMPFCSNRMKFLCWYAHQANINKAPGLLLIVDHLGELVEDNGLGCEVAAEGFEGPGLDPSNEGQDKE
jgi:hypothetical protein